MVTVLALMLHTAQCTVMVRRTKGNVLSQPLRCRIGVSCFFVWEFNFGENQWSKLIMEDI